MGLVRFRYSVLRSFGGVIFRFLGGGVCVSSSSRSRRNVESLDLTGESVPETVDMDIGEGYRFDRSNPRIGESGGDGVFERVERGDEGSEPPEAGEDVEEESMAAVIFYEAGGGKRERRRRVMGKEHSGTSLAFWTKFESRKDRQHFRSKTRVKMRGWSGHEKRRARASVH